MLFTSLLTGPRRLLLLGLAIVAAIAFGSQGLDYASTWLARRRAAKDAEAAVQAHAGRAAAEPTGRHNFDSTFFILAGQSREVLRQAHLLKQADDSLTRRLPAAPALPADPPRQ